MCLKGKCVCSKMREKTSLLRYPQNRVKPILSINRIRYRGDGSLNSNFVLQKRSNQTKKTIPRRVK